MDREKNLAEFLANNHPDVPHVAYHGSGKDIKKFNTTRGAWFTDKPSLAGEYAGEANGSVYPVHLAIKKPIEFVHAEQRKKIGEIISHATNGAGDLAPEQIDKAKTLINELRQTHGDEPKALFEFWRNDPNVSELFRTLGYDGISAFEKADRKTKTWAALNPAQIKSATGNQGTFNPSEPDITKADGGALTDDEGITAYHGSPHDFERFDMSKIGTGEGAQAYGHGLYFAEHEPIAQSYRDALTKGAQNMTIDGGKFHEFYNSTDPEKALKAKVALNMLHGRDLHDAIDWQFQQTTGKLSSKRLLPEDEPILLEDLMRLQAFKKKPPLIEKNPGHMYEVHINAHPDHFLDWDKPLWQQPTSVRRIAGWSPEHDRQYFDWLKNDTDGLAAELEGTGTYKPVREPVRPRGSLPRSMRGSEIHEHFKDKFGATDWPVGSDAPARTVYGNRAAQRVSDHFLKNGIKGIKYLDASSRGNTDKPTSNYVVFDDKLVNVKRKYEKGGIVQGEAPIHALRLTSKFGNSLPSAVNQAKAATRRRP